MKHIQSGTRIGCNTATTPRKTEPALLNDAQVSIKYPNARARTMSIEGNVGAAGSVNQHLHTVRIKCARRKNSAIQPDRRQHSCGMARQPPTTVPVDSHDG
eukprot:TRINITY_DN17565_c0_g1_i1.p3 TRINITY_DN17565_c0_g1~~TRINITY_DN17565_c0_g1_i1.p3  ORF type:complete len:101 (+),score=0.77 TRINITY_DN17565_c0_g1_i1:310-612(+)